MMKYRSKSRKRSHSNPRTPTSEFAQRALEAFQSFGEIEMQRMFSGYGLFHNDLMFALVFDQAVYLKADAYNVAEFQALGLGQFQYERDGKIVSLSYYRLPDSVMDDPIEAARWARLAFEAALRVAVSKAKAAWKRH